MAVAKMSVMTLVGLISDKSAILDEMQKCGAAQIRSAKEYALTKRSDSERIGDLTTLKERTEKCIEIVSSAVDEIPQKERKESFIKDGFSVSRREFFSMSEKGEEMNALFERIEKLNDERNDAKIAAAKKASEIKTYEPYAEVEERFSFFADTAYCIVRFGLLGADKQSKAESFAAEKGFVFQTLARYNSEIVVAVVGLKSRKDEIEDVLAEMGFKRCPFAFDYTAGNAIERLKGEYDRLIDEANEIRDELAALAKSAREMKIYADYLAFCIEKEQAEVQFGETDAAFVMEAYVPTEKTSSVENKIRDATQAVFVEFEEVPETEFAPTLNKNGKIVSNFEAVTNMYSAPAYGALDPNAVMSFFFSLFMGIIMADVGYGLLMIVGGFLFAKKQREGSSIARMAKVFAYGGFFAVIAGAVFDSWLGYPLLRRTLGAGYNAFYEAHLNQITAMTSIAGIDIPAILMWCLAFGTFHLGVGLLMKAYQDFSRKKILEGVFGGIVWAIVMFSLIVWIFGVATNNSSLSTGGMYVTAGAAILGILTAGIAEKGLGKVTKVFSSAYGIINYVSDILSYCRLYGLMLSGAQIASIFTNTLAIEMLFPQGVIGIIFGVIIIIVGNVFNLAINLLGAYIHDARLQYVEFYGKFYEGEGELFTPFGSRLDHSYFEG
ncbi:MAG: hypothetical protein IJ800_00290 [Clostridia bacterium]|nr:hypothetical protein [Clostridia bacterium]